MSLTLTDGDKRGLREMRSFFNDFLKNERGSSELVREYLKQINERDEVLLYFLWGRKNRSKYAWETLKRNAEVRLVEYPELFPTCVSSEVESHFKGQNLLGVLKARDNKGRYVVIFNAGAWDPEKCSLEDVLIVFIRLMEKLLKVESFAKHGFTYIQQCWGVGFKHARQYSLSAIRKLITVFWNSFPIQLKVLHYVNVPYFIHYVFALGRTFYPKKLKERLIISTMGTGFKEIHNLVSPNKLPEFLGGQLSFQEAMEPNLSPI